MAKLHLVFGGALKSPGGTVFADPENIDIVGIFPDYDSAHRAWKTAAQRTVDDAHTRYFIAHLHRLMDESREGSATREIEG
ncbi:MAG: DUF4170 domain-containing protein [Rhodobacteraceae bacterium]|nr:DUF4170 domain-containing protein [Paracoccaceae bacterium]